jgi:serine/threonine protein kinase
MIEGYKVVDSSGYTSTVYYLPGDPPRVCKSFNEECTHFPVEEEAYKRFSANDHPSSILKYYGIHDSIPAGIILELAEKTNLYKYRWVQNRSGNPDPETEVLYRWAGQAAEGLEFAQSLGVYNSDIHCVNFFLDEDLNLEVGDWAGLLMEARHIPLIDSGTGCLMRAERIFQKLRESQPSQKYSPRAPHYTLWS